MPYEWTPTNAKGDKQLRLWPHQSLPPRGMAAFILTTFALLSVPMVPFVGSAILWALLPFLMLALWGVYQAIQANYRARLITEDLSLGSETVHLSREGPHGRSETWDCNRYWVRVQKYDTEGPVPHYVTLKGNGREVEIGAFLSEDERIALFDELIRALNRI